jgi:hypothetical protein
MKFEYIIALGAAAAAAYLFFRPKEAAAAAPVSSPPTVIEAPAPIITPVVVIPPTITPAADITTTTIYNVVMEAPAMPAFEAPAAPAIDTRSPDLIAYEAWRDAGADPNLDPSLARNQPGYVAPISAPGAPQTIIEKIITLPKAPEQSELEITGRQLSKEHAPGWGVFAPTPAGYEGLAQHNAPEPTIFDKFNVKDIFGVGGFQWL